MNSEIKLDSTRPTVIVFSLPGCVPCENYKQDLVNHIAEVKRIANLVFTEALKNPDEDIKYNVRSAPTTVILRKDGSVFYNGNLCKTFEQLKVHLEQIK